MNPMYQNPNFPGNIPLMYPQMMQNYNYYPRTFGYQGYNQNINPL